MGSTKDWWPGVDPSGPVLISSPWPPLLQTSVPASMPKGSSATPPAKSARKAHIPGLNLKSLANSLPAKDLAEAVEQLGADVPPATAPHRDDPDYWSWYRSLRALEVTLVAAAGGDPAIAKGLVAELGQKVGVRMGAGVEGVVCDRLRDFVADLKEENKPEPTDRFYQVEGSWLMIICVCGAICHGTWV